MELQCDYIYYIELGSKTILFKNNLIEKINNKMFSKSFSNNQKIKSKIKRKNESTVRRNHYPNRGYFLDL